MESPRSALSMMSLASGDRAVIFAAGPLTRSTAPEFVAMASRIVANGATALTLDLRDLTALDGVGVRAIVETHRLAPVSLREPQGPARRRLQASALVTVLPSILQGQRRDPDT